ncbi:hypothetical protein N431DRAFT_442058 [Stipitochalara longipes BDJ]|nr:hypothetical protein N431DRAFT_442058 [Stipitochalara longipes BDJ]
MKLQFLILMFIVLVFNTRTPVLANPAGVSTFSTSIASSASTSTPSSFELPSGQSAYGDNKTSLHIADEATPQKPPSKGLKTFEKVMIVILFIVILVGVLLCYCAWEHRAGLAQVAMRAAI